MNSLAWRKYRNNINQFSQFLFLAFVMQVLSGCGSLAGIETLVAAEKDPQSVVGKYFEVDSGKGLFGTQDIQRYETVTSGIKADPVGGMKTLFELAKQKVFVNLNKGVNSEQDKANLIYKIVDFKQYPTKDLFFKIHMSNKQYMDGDWWISATDFAKGKPAVSPYPNSYEGLGGKKK